MEIFSAVSSLKRIYICDSQQMDIQSFKTGTAKKHQSTNKPKIYAKEQKTRPGALLFFPEIVLLLLLKYCHL